MQSHSSLEKQPQLTGDGKSFPLSHGQQAMWFLYQIAPQSVAYNIYITVRLCSELDLGAWHRAWLHIVERHPILRTTYTERGGQPLQVVHPYQEIDVKVTDASSWSEDYLNKQILAEADHPFNLETGPVLRVHLFTRSSAEEHIQLLAMHHIAGDMWSFDILLDELRVLYAAEVKTLPQASIHVVENSDISNSETDNILSLPTLSYTDYVRWQTEMLASSKGEQLSAYWQKQLAGELPLLDLPVDKLRPSVQTYRGATHIIELDEELLQKLKKFSESEITSLYRIFLAAFFVLFYRLSGQEDILVGCPVAGRSGQEEFERIVGYFTDPVVLRANLAGNPTFKEFLAQVRRTVSEAKEHQDYPFPLLVKQLAPDRDLSRPPLFQVSFTWQKHRWYDKAQKLPLEPGKTLLVTEPYLIEGHQRGAAFDLDLALIEAGSSLQLCWHYNTDLFDASTVHRIAGSYQTLLLSILTNPDQRVSALPLLTQAERHQLLVEWNDTKVEYPQEKCIHQLFEEQVERTPDAVAVEFEHEHLTYRELNCRANQLAHYLHSLGVGPEVLVGICVERSLLMVVGLLAILKVGGAYVPLDTAYPTERLAYMLSDSQVKVLLTQEKLADSLPVSAARVIYLDSDWQNIGDRCEENPLTEVKVSNLAYVIYTSGSTGKPKGVMIEHRSIVNFTSEARGIYNITHSDRVLQFASIAFDGAAVEIFPCLSAGGTLVLRTDDMLLSGNRFVQRCREWEITMMDWPTSHWHQVMVELAAAEQSLPESLRVVSVGGDAVKPETLKLWLRCVKGLANPPQLLNGYGPTEATVVATYYDLSEFIANNPAASCVPIGTPIGNVTTYVLNRHLQPVPIGVPGELHIGGLGLARGYLSRPETTAEKFIPNPFSNEPSARLYKTGDLVRYLSDGSIEFLGRIDNQVKIRGFRIELGEIEAAIAQHRSVRETVVVAREDVPDRKYLAAYIVPNHSDALASSDLRSFLKEKLPDYMIPGAFVMLDTLPLTPNGKVDRRALPAPKLHLELEASFVAPCTPIEEMLACIWANILLIDPVGIHDNFFELGGHSLLATQVISRVRDTLTVELPLRSLFEAPTIAELAERVEKSLKNGQSQEALPLLPIPRSESIPLSFAQARLCFLDQLQPNSAFYNIPLALRLSGQLNITALQSSINEIILRHEALRTNFTIVEGQPVQIIASTKNLKLLVVDLLHLRESEREIEAQRLANVEANRPFNLEREPLLRGMVLQLGETEYVLLLTLHHIISDGWSLGVFVRELTELYKAFCTGKPPRLPELPVQYADFALWQRQWLQGEILEAQLDYWKEQLKNAPSLLELPTDRPRPADQTYRGGYHYAAVSLELSGKLSALSKRTGVTLFMTLLAAFQTLFYRYTGQDDIVVGTPIAGRNRREIEGLIGFFVNTLVLRTNLGGDPSFEDVLSRVREVTLQAYTYQDLPFEQLVEALQPTRDLSYNPLFQVMFALDDALVPSVKLPELTVSSYAVEIGTAKFDLTLSMENTADGLVGVWAYNADLFDETTIARMARHFQTLLEGIVANPQQKVSSLPLLTERERHQLLIDWNNTTKEYPFDKCIHQLFEEQVERSPDAVAVVFEGEQLTYQQLNARANQLAHYLQSLGVGPEVLVGICVERSLEMVVGLLGILKAGGAYVPLDPAYPKDRLSHMLSSQVSVVLTTEKSIAQLPKQIADVVRLDADWGVIEQMSEENPLSNVQATNLAYVIYTSGSTGKPKGITIEHRSVLNLGTGLHQAIYAHYQDSQLRVSVNGSLSFDTSVKQIIQLLYGHTLEIVPEATRFDGNALLSFLQKHKIDVFDCTPSQLGVLIAAGLLASKSAPKAVLVGGEKIDESTWLALRQAENINFYNVYGPTECTVDATVGSVKMAGSKPVIGRPITNTQIYILDRHLQPVPVGVAGELYIGGHGLARGYLNRPDLTQEKFIPNPFNNQPSSRLYKTGDLGRYLSDGNIEFLGRIDNQVKIRGFRIELGEIETALAQYPGVRETAVIAREDVLGHKYLVAYIVPNHSSALASSDLHGFLKQKLPDYMIPGVFVCLDALPLTPNGKVDRKALPIPGTARQELQADKVAPRTRSEEILAQIWCEVFHREVLSIHDNFFELGGDSILSIQIISKANSAGLLLTPKQIFQHQTIAELAAIATTTKTLKAFQGLVTGSLPLTPIQHRFFEQDIREHHHFNQALLLEVPPTLNPDLLQQALQQLLLHHDALRLRFNQSEACWQQFNALPDETVPFSFIDLSTLQEGALSQTIEPASSQLQASLNLNSGPLLRVALFHLGSQKPSRLLLVIHHLAIDGVSWRILLEDLQTAYKKIESGKPIQLPAKTTSFKHWAEKITEYAQSPAAKKELTYWSNISTPKITHLPVDCNQGANTKASARSVKVSLTLEETRALLQEIHKSYHTQINDILLTALVQVLATWSGSNSILIDLEGHGREEILPDVDLSHTVGWFTTIFPVHLELKATENLPDAIKSIKKQLRAIPNRGIGYGVLRYLSGDAEITSQLSSIPQAEVSFNYLGQFDWGMQENSFVKLASESVGPEHSQLGQRSHLLEINGLVVENQLQLEWTYSSNFHSWATIESLAQDFAETLRSLIAHCLSPEAGGYTPDVFEQTIHSEAQHLNSCQREEDNAVPLHLLELPEGISELLPDDTETAYPLAKMQEFMLHHYKNDPQKLGVYHSQKYYDIYDESLNLNAFKKALEIIVQKHPAFRTVFITRNGTPVVQVVKKSLSFSIIEQDISHIKSDDQENYIDVVMKRERQNLFKIENPNKPLFRFGIFRKAKNRFDFLMSVHHAITDGWGNSEFFNQLYELYSALKKGEEITVVPSTNVYKEFVALEKEIIGSQDAADFWRLHLNNYIYKPLKPRKASVNEGEAVTQECLLNSEIIVDLQNLCRKLRVSLKAIFLSTYLDLIGTLMKTTTVGVGIVSNGRTERLSDPFGALGLFWNMVPFCQSISSDKGVQIKNVQQSLIDIEPYVRYPLLEILSDQQKPDLFFATFNFVHFHNAKNIKADTGLKVNGIRSHDKFNFPLNYAVSISPVEGNVSLSVEYDRMYFSCQEIRLMIQNYIEILKHTAHTSELY